MAVGETWPNEAGLDQNQNNWIQRLSSLLRRIWGTSYPWAHTSREVWLNATGSAGVLCSKADDAWFADHRVELPVIDKKDLYLHAEEQCLVLVFFVDKPGTEEGWDFLFLSGFLALVSPCWQVNCPLSPLTHHLPGRRSWGGDFYPLT